VSTPRIVVYGPRETPFTLKVTRALRLKGLPFESVEPRSLEDYRRFSPETGLLPVIEVEGRRIHDSSAILDFLEERFPEPSLLSSDPRIAREQRRLEAWVSETFDYYILRWIRARGIEVSSEPGEGKGGPMSRRGLIGPDGRLRAEIFDTTDGGPGPEFERRLDDMAQLLGPRPFFFGERPSRADLAVFSSLYGMYRDTYPGAREMLAQRPALVAFVERMERASGGPEEASAP
jgi:glutathione S-transferase